MNIVQSMARPGSLHRLPVARATQWRARYAMFAYGALWIGASAAGGAAVLVGIRLSTAGALWFDVAGLAVLIPLRRTGLMSAADLGLRATPAARAVGGVLLVVAGSVVFDALWRAALSVGPVSSPLSALAAKSATIIVLTGIAVVVSPVVEEIVFRGLLYRALRNRLPTLPASLVIGVMFALIHTQYAAVALPELAVYGALLCLLYESTGSIWPGIALNVFLDSGSFERALTGSYTIAVWGFVALMLGLLVRGLHLPRNGDHSSASL